jgi:cardiolipin synthase
MSHPIRRKRKARRRRIIALIVTLFYVSGIVAAAHAVMTVRTAQGAIAWSVSLVSFPFVAVPAYLVFGRSRFAGVAEAYEQRADEIDELVNQIRSNLAPWVAETEGRNSVSRAVRKLANMELTHGNRVDLLVDGDATFDSILAGIAGAREYILFQFYMIHDDGLGRRVQNALIDKAREGVRVYVLYDEVGSHALPGSYTEQLRRAGIEVSSFRPTQGSQNRFQLNFRNHRTMVVVDGTAGWVGGLNVGDEYLGLDPGFSPWRDTHVRLEGPSVIQLQAVIVSDWYWATRELPELNWRPTAAEGSNTRAMIVPFSPTQRLESAGLFFVSALHAARTRIWISAPYFVPDEAVISALELAALRGVDVRIITTGTTDSWPVYLAGFHYVARLRDLGIRFYAYQPGFLHEKVMLIDDRISTVGTPNFDNRSFRLNFEVTALIDDEDFATQMEQMFTSDFAHSTELDPAEYDEKPFWWRLGVSLSRLAAPVL